MGRIALCVILVCGASEQFALAAQESEPVGTEAEEAEQGFPLTVPLIFNGRFVGDLAIMVTASGVASARPSDIATILGEQIRPELAEEISAKGDELRPVDEIGGEVLALTFDSGLLQLNATIRGEGLAETNIRLSGRTPPDPQAFYEPSDFAAYLDIAASRRYVHDDGRGDAFLEGFNVSLESVVSIGGFDGIALTAAADRRPTPNRFDFRDTALIKDFYDSAVRVEVGEISPRRMSFQATPDLLGIGVSRRYQEIQPFRNIRPSGRRSFFLEQPSTVEVYINGQLARTLQLQEGPFTLDDLPLIRGANDVELVIIDPTGERSVISYSPTVRPVLLAPGLTDFSFTAGALTTGGFSTGREANVTGFYLRGFENLTLGANAQASEDAAQLGFLASFGGAWGALSVQGAGSTTFDQSRQGWALALDYAGDFNLSDVNELRIDSSIEYTSRNFTDFLDPAPVNSQVLTGAVTASYRLTTTATATFGGFASIGRDEVFDTYRLSAGFQKQLGRTSFGVLASHGFFQDREDEFRLTLRLTRRFGDSYSVSATADPVEGRYGLEAARFGQRELGEVSGRLRYDFDDTGSDLTGEVDYLANRAFLGLRHGRSVVSGPDGSTNEFTQVTVNTAIGYAGGKIGIGRGNAFGGFALVDRHKTLKGKPVEVYEGTLLQAKAGALGPVLVPIERSYTTAVRNFTVEDLPAGYDIGYQEVRFFPGFFDGYTVQIGSDASRTVLGSLFDSAGEAIALAVGELRGGDTPIQFFTNSGGRFVAERVAPGRYEIVLRDRVVGEIVIDEEQEGLVNVGRLTIARP